MVIKKLIKGSAAAPVAVIAALLIIYFFFLPPVLKFIIEKEGSKRLGRKVEVGYTTFNVFRGSFNMRNLRVYEPDGKSLFLSFRHFYINLNIREVLGKTYHIESVGLDEPVLHISQVDSTFNFSDILDRFSPDPTRSQEEETADTSGPVNYIVEDFAITSGTVSYVNPDFHLKDTIKNLQLTTPKFAWDDPELFISFFFDLASGGNFKGNMSFNIDDQSMALNDTISNFNLSNYKYYLEPYLKVGSMNGFLNTRNSLKGNTDDFNLEMSGNLAIRDFSMTDTNGVVVAAFRNFSVTFDSISFSRDVMNFDTISLVDPVINFSLTPQGDNFTSMMPSTSPSDTTTTGETITETAYGGQNPLEMMVAYVQESMNTYLFQSYRINQITLRNGKVVYDDFTLDEPFKATIDSLNLELTNLNTDVDRSSGKMSARLNDEGRFRADINVNPRNLLDMDLNYEISSLMVPDFNPFSVYYIAYPFPRGSFNYKGSLIIVNRKLTSENKIVIEKIYLGDKVKNSTAVSLPIKLALAILRDRQGDIKLDVPVTGDLNDPKVKIGRIILDILKNIIIKAATAPYDMFAAAFGGNAEDYKDLRYDYLQSAPGEKQQSQLARIAMILTDKPELNVTFTQVVDPSREKAEIALFETKKVSYFEYFKNQQVPAVLSRQDSLEIEKIDARTDLNAFFTARLDETLLALSLEEKCYYIAGVDKVNKMQEELMEARNQQLRSYMKDKLIIPEERFVIGVSSDPSLVKPDYPYFSIKFDVKE